MKTLVLVSALLQPAPPPSVPALYSFNDVYRLTVNGAAMGGFPPAAAPLRTAAAAQPPRAERGFSIREVPAPDHALLVIAGLAAAFWVARRRLGYAL